MKTDLPAYVYKRTNGAGRVYFYFERQGIRRRIDPASPDFWQTYADLLGTKPAVTGKRTFRKLIDHYKASSWYREKAPRTKRDYERVFARILDRMPDADPRQVRKVHVVEWQDQLSGRFASYFVQVLSILMRHACDIGWRDDNPCDNVRLAKTERKAAHVPWTDEAVAVFREKAGPVQLLIFEIGLGTVQRPDDWTRFNWEDYDGASLHVVQGKTGRQLRVPCPPRLHNVLELHRPKVLNLNGKTPILALGRKRMSYRYMAALMLAERKRLGVKKHDLHALRYRGVMELAWAGVDDDGIMSVSGHRSKAMVEKYAGIARQIMLSKKAQAQRGA